MTSFFKKFIIIIIFRSSDLGASSEPSLGEMFEQIKHCRYIRHYRPDGTEIEEYD